MSMIDRSSMTVTLPADVWTRIVFAAKESEDWKLRTLIEQAVHETPACPADPKEQTPA